MIIVILFKSTFRNRETVKMMNFRKIKLRKEEQIVIEKETNYFQHGHTSWVHKRSYRLSHDVYEKSQAFKTEQTNKKEKRTF